MQTATAPADYGTPERHAKGGVEIRPIKHGSGKHVDYAAVNVAEAVIDALYEAKRLGPTSKPYDAALWLKNAVHAAGIVSRVSGSYSPRGWGGGDEGYIEDPEDLKHAAVRSAMRAMGPFAWIVWEVVIEDKMRTSLNGLVEGLERLAKHRGI